MDTPADETAADQTADQNTAEAVDETVTTPDGDGETVTSRYPPDRPVGVEDPAIVQGDAAVRDDLVTREWRRRPEPVPGETPSQDEVDRAKGEYLGEVAGIPVPDAEMAEAERAQWVAEQEIRVGEATENGR